MAIPSRQIGASTTTNLLWQISKQLERLICVRAGGCGSTTTTTSTVAPTTTTTTTSTPLIGQSSAYIPCEPCGTPCAPSIVIIYTEQACIDNITIGCHMYSDETGTSNISEGYYYGWNGVGYFYVDANGLVLNIDVCPQPK